MEEMIVSTNLEKKLVKVYIDYLMNLDFKSFLLVWTDYTSTIGDNWSIGTLDNKTTIAINDTNNEVFTEKGFFKNVEYNYDNEFSNYILNNRYRQMIESLFKWGLTKIDFGNEGK